MTGSGDAGDRHGDWVAYRVAVLPAAAGMGAGCWPCC